MTKPLPPPRGRRSPHRGTRTRSEIGRVDPQRVGHGGRALARDRAGAVLAAGGLALRSGRHRAPRVRQGLSVLRPQRLRVQGAGAPGQGGEGVAAKLEGEGTAESGTAPSLLLAPCPGRGSPAHSASCELSGQGEACPPTPQTRESLTDEAKRTRNHHLPAGDTTASQRQLQGGILQ